MRLLAFSIKDELTGYKTPIINASEDDMKRTFSLEAANPGSLINKCKKDFSLWLIGEWDTDTGIFLNYNEKKLIERAENIE